MDNQNEIVIYQADEAFQMEVRVENETVWLTQAQMSDLFQTTSQNITMHIKNVYAEGELALDSTCKEILQVQIEGKRKVNRKYQFYNLDVIISVGYRVKSQRGTQFRIWANKILKEYMLRGYAVNQRFEHIERRLHEHDKKFDLLIKTSLPPNEGIFYDGQIFDAHTFVSNLIKSATKSIVLIDNYIDETVLTLLSKRQKNVSATIFTHSISKQFQLDIQKFNKQYAPVEVNVFTKSHDRFLIIDNEKVYHIGASLKDLGKKWFAFSLINLNANELIQKLT